MKKTTKKKTTRAPRRKVMATAPPVSRVSVDMKTYYDLMAKVDGFDLIYSQLYGTKKGFDPQREWTTDDLFAIADIIHAVVPPPEPGSHAMPPVKER